MRHMFGTRLKNVKIKTSLVLPVVAGVPLALTGIFPAVAAADGISNNFESFSTGSVDGQDGWGMTGAYDAGVANNTYGFSSFGSKSFRISDAVTSGSFGDWVFAKPLANAVGEADATDGSFSPGTLQRHFEMQFDVASTQATEQTGMHFSVSPDRGDGSRMSYVGFFDTSGGIDIKFYDVEGTGNPANFVAHDLGTYSRSTPHTVKLTMDTLDGPSNDVVKAWVDGSLKVTGTSWENYYRYDSEASAEQSPRIVKTVIIQSRGNGGSDNNAADLGNGFLVDNLSYSSGAVPATVPTHYSQCRGDGWKQFTDPSFKNRGKCMKYVWQHARDIEGDDVRYTAYGLKREANFWMSTSLNRGHFHYSDANHDWYDVQVSDVSASDSQGYFAGKVTHASNPAWVGNWLYGEVQDGHPDQIWGSFTTQTAAETGVDAMTPSPADGPFAITHGRVSIDHRW